MIPDYYILLGVRNDATQEEITLAYKRLSLIYHPEVAGEFSSATSVVDRTEVFHQLADAFYTLSDPARRQQYDEARQRDMKSIYDALVGSKTKNSDQIFVDAFEEVMRPEVEKIGWVWWGAGAVAGGTLGYIIANIPGATVGALVGGKMGQVRDRKGKSLYEVYGDLNHSQRHDVIMAIAKKVIL